MAELLPEQIEALIATAEGRGVWFQSGRVHYLAGWPDRALMLDILATLAAECGLVVRHLPQGLRLRRHGGLEFAFNYARAEADIANLVPEGASLLLGERKLGAAGVAAWTTA